jgi:ABC-type amino acid transport substrate-binding protein
VLPALVAFVTPLHYRDVVGPARDALVTAFATGNLLVVLPILAASAKNTLLEAGVRSPTSESAVDVLIPASFTIPNMGKLISLAFVPFAGWFTGAELSPLQYPLFATIGFLSFFGEPVISIPFLLDLFRIPADVFQLFVTIDLLTGRFATLLAAAHTLVLGVLAGFLIAGKSTFRWRGLVRFCAWTALALILPILGTRLLFTYAVDPQYTGYREFVELELMFEPARSRVLERLPEPLPDGGGDRLDVIRRRGTMRVGYFSDALPFVFRNASGTLVGFDVEMAHLLARELDVGLEFVRIERNDASDQLNRGICDLVVSGIPVTPERARRVAFSEPVMDLTLAMIVPDHERQNFSSWDAIRRRDGLRVGIGKSGYFRRQLRALLPDAELVTFPSPREFFRASDEPIDALAFTAEAGSAWTLVYPAFAVTVPTPSPITVSASYAVPRGEAQLRDYVDAFVRLKIQDHTTHALFGHWFEGRSPSGRAPRWSIAHDVLGWI